MNTPSISRIANNFTQVTVNGITVWYSYATPVAFQAPGQMRVVHRNYWGVTTGKHLNRIDGGDSKTASGRVAQAARVDAATFKAEWDGFTASRAA